MPIVIRASNSRAFCPKFFYFLSFSLLAGLLLLYPTGAFAFDAAKGKKVFLKCKACHTADKGGAHRIGPNLWGVIGRVAGTQEGFKYSKAMISFGKKWDVATLDAYLEKPSRIVPKSRMTFVGIKDGQQRADLIAYLNEQSDKPIKLQAIKRKKTESSGGGASKSTAKSTAKSAAKSTEGSLLVKGNGMEETDAYCSSCHSLRLVIQQGLSESGWDELLDWMVEEQGMEEIEASDRQKIVKYLAKHYDESRPNFQKDK